MVPSPRRGAAGSGPVPHRPAGRLGPLLDEPHTKQLDGKLRELRFYLESRPTRITYWIASGRLIVLLTIFVRPVNDNATRSTVSAERCRLASAMSTRSMTEKEQEVTPKRTNWTELIAAPLTDRGRAAYDNEDRISEFREFVFRLRTEAGYTQGELALKMGTTQSAIARMEGGGTRPTLDTLEKLAIAVGAELVVGVAPCLSENRSIAKLVREGHAVLRSAS